MNHKSKTEWVYETIKRHILEGKWPPGERRNADDIARSLKVSRTPVVSASKLLETEGLLTIIPQVGMEVPSLTIERIEETFYIRGALSDLATALACRHLTQKDLEKLDSLVRLMNRSVLARDARSFSKLNREFHYAIFKGCKMSHLVMLLSRYWDSGTRYAKFFNRLPKIMISSAKRHYEIVEALKRHDEVGARSAAEKDSVDFGLAVARFLVETRKASAGRKK